jgi:hypothetical protein
MQALFDLIGKYWKVLSLCFTLLSSLVTGAYYFVERIKKAEATVASLNAWVSDHDDTLTDHDKRISKLEEDERLREAGLLKR